MYIFKVIFDVCYWILSIPISLFGFQITLFNVVVYTAVGSLLVFVLFRLLR